MSERDSCSEPFVKISADADQEYFADALTDNLVTDLSRLSGLFVISRHSAFVHKGTLKALAWIAGVTGGALSCKQDKLKCPRMTQETLRDRRPIAN